MHVEEDMPAALDIIPSETWMRLFINFIAHPRAQINGNSYPVLRSRNFFSCIGTPRFPYSKHDAVNVFSFFSIKLVSDNAVFRPAFAFIDGDLYI